MVYDWDGKRDDCYRMYIDEKRPLEAIMEYMRATYNFAPSKRAFQTQFKRWGFPSKQNPAHKNDALVARVHELWTKNTSQKEMLRILNDEEGFGIKERELMRLRGNNRWLLREANGMKTAPASDMNVDNGDGTNGANESDLLADGSNASAISNLGRRLGLVNDLPAEVISKRQARMDRLQKESDDRWATRKRRRRTRGWAGLPPDPPQPPRFPSEMTIEEAKGYLRLDSVAYRTMRDEFQHICEQEGVIKKTIAGSEVWQNVKNRLVRENAHLQAVIEDDTTDSESKKQGLDVICCDVTKRMRTLERRMTIAEAKNTLGINPEQSRQIRTAFYQILLNDHFTSKLEAGDEHWNELKSRWIENDVLLKAILAPGASDPQHKIKVKAVEVLSRDVMKRLRDDQTKKDPGRARNASTRSSFAPPVPQIPSTSQTVPGSNHTDLQIDPSLLLAANDPSLAMGQDGSFVNGANGFGSMVQFPVNAYCRITQQPNLNTAPRLWLETLYSGSLSELHGRVLHQLATNGPAHSTITKIEGVSKDVRGRDVVSPIEEDDELLAYLEHVRGAKASFHIQVTPDFDGN